MDLEYINEHVIKSVMRFIGEFLGYSISILIGFLIIILRNEINYFMDYIGLGFLREANRRIADINSDCLELQGRIKADAYALIRVYNGKYFSYVNDSKINVKRMNCKPKSFMHSSLNRNHFNSFFLFSTEYDWKFLTYEQIKAIDDNSPLLIILEEHKISSVYIHKLSDRDKEGEKFYGFVVFAWKQHMTDNEFLSNFNMFERRMLDSIHLRFVSYIESSVFEKFGIRRFT